MNISLWNTLIDLLVNHLNISRQTTFWTLFKLWQHTPVGSTHCTVCVWQLIFHLWNKFSVLRKIHGRWTTLLSPFPHFVVTEARRPVLQSALVELHECTHEAQMRLRVSLSGSLSQNYASCLYLVPGAYLIVEQLRQCSPFPLCLQAVAVTGWVSLSVQRVQVPVSAS